MSYVFGAVRYCENKSFWRFLASETNNPVTDKETAAVQLRMLCGIKSRSELNTNQFARAAYIGLITRFNDFLRRERQ
ncbi:hypothetical protein H8I91_25090 [Serratia fonticola]|uniref:hypothetical protein n=1 Tax=Serratia fonticola TaxID=47917 RepID=UPI001648916D|nr:hypothetical protein [Serratia fonticola]MBC3253544.1 hypothetical protein [Serratia fonticola]